MLESQPSPTPETPLSIESNPEKPTPTLDKLKQLYGEPVAQFGELLLFNLNPKNADQPYHVAVTINHQTFPYDIPPGYGIKGGAARNYILTSLGEPIEPPRDIDIVAITDLDADTRPEIARPIEDTYMPEDSQNNHGVEITKLTEYFAERDFTINEAVVFPDVIMASPEAWSDLASKTIRPTYYEKNRWHIYETNEWGVHPKLALKALRLMEEFCEMYGYGQICGINDRQFKANRLPDFFIALQLNKALQRGPRHAANFFEALVNAGTIDLDPEGNSTEIPDTHDNLIIASNAEHLAQILKLKLMPKLRKPFEFNNPNLNITHTEEVNLGVQADWFRYQQMASDYAQQHAYQPELDYPDPKNPLTKHLNAITNKTEEEETLPKPKFDQTQFEDEKYFQYGPIGIAFLLAQDKNFKPKLQPYQSNTEEITQSSMPPEILAKLKSLDDEDFEQFTQTQEPE